MQNRAEHYDSAGHFLYCTPICDRLSAGRVKENIQKDKRYELCQANYNHINFVCFKAHRTGDISTVSRCKKISHIIC